MKNQIKQLVICFMVLLIICANLSTKAYSLDSNSDDKKILIINSYHFDEPWEASIFSGIKSILDKGFKKIVYNFEYLDSKQNAIDTEQMIKDYTIKFKNQKYDLIVVCDDEAFEAFNQCYEDIFYGTPVVYTSINDPNIKINDTLKNFSTGVKEEQPITDIVELALKLHSDVKVLNFLFDNSKTSTVYINEVKKIEKKYKDFKFNIIQTDNIEQVINKLQETEKNSINFIYGVYKDRNNEILNRTNIANIIVNYTKAPLYTWAQPYFSEAVLGGIVLDGLKIGQATGKICYKVLNGEEAKMIEPIMDKNFKYMFNYDVMKKCSIKNKELPRNAEIMNDPSIFNQIPAEIKAAIISIIAILSLIVILLFVKMEYKNELYKKAIEYENLRTEFFANISHELRTPLNIILSTLQLHDMYVENGNIIYKNETTYKRMGALKQNSMRLLRLINNLIDITKIDAGYFNLQCQSLNIVEFIEDITMSVANYIERKNISLIFDTEIEEKTACFDPNKMERIILNLLSNAVKFTPKGGTIYVDIYDEQDKVKIIVRDTGVGIPKDKQEIIFERFRQVDNLLTRNQEGSGIGLSLTKALVEMHGGKIYIESEVNMGSSFIIEIPCGACAIEDNYDKSFINSHEDEINLEFSDIYD
ncbi:sensor histidine kinase [Clostridium sp. UBA6640]|uniref:sensor histidine kinase n=1 Tax=Clostridium sp. UBA6640 TaxID=1946370 RepID=UPI0025C23893|nr:sensor histidine kinase [Clostridium sp. UBA6640]